MKKKEPKNKKSKNDVANVAKVCKASKIKACAWLHGLRQPCSHDVAM